jgi:tetratricopeptide (TPR) repeat protein
MKKKSRVTRVKRGEFKKGFGNFLKCLCSGDQLRTEDKMVPSFESLSIEDYGNEIISRAREIAKQPDTGNIEEAELSLRKNGVLNYEEARAVLGRYEYQKGNVEAALRVFEGIDISMVAPNIKSTLSRRVERRRRSSQNIETPQMSIPAVSLILEAIFLKSKSLQALGRFKEAAQSSKFVVDIVESSLPEGLPENFGAECKLQETIIQAVELLPELWKLADCPSEAILSYRQALLHPWNLDSETAARIQKEFAIYLLYSGVEAAPPNLRFQMDGSFVPKNNLEEAILLLMILLRKISLKRIEWDQSILDHLSFALSISGDTRSLAHQVEELLPGIIRRNERYYILALCYYGAGDCSVALDLLKKLISSGDDPNHIPALLMASKICEEIPNFEQGVHFARRALEILDSRCDQLKSTANYLLGASLSLLAKSAVTDSERVSRQSEALRVLETAGKLTRMEDPIILYQLSLGNAEQRKLNDALHYAKNILKLEGGSNIKTWLLLARILSAQKRFVDAEVIIDTALEQTGKWDQGELLRTKAKLHTAQGHIRNAIETYTQILAILQVQKKSIGSEMKLHKSGSRRSPRSLELEIWHDLTYIYIRLSQWRDAEVCLSKSKSLCSYSATRWHATGVLYEAKGEYKEALKAFLVALNTDPTHVPSLISTAEILRQLNNESVAIVRSFLMEALRLDRMNHSAWYNLGMFYKSKGNNNNNNGSSSSLEAAECFEAAISLEETAPVETFR